MKSLILSLLGVCIFSSGCTTTDRQTPAPVEVYLPGAFKRKKAKSTPPLAPAASPFVTSQPAFEKNWAEQSEPALTQKNKPMRLFKEEPLWKREETPLQAAKTQPLETSLNTPSSAKKTESSDSKEVSLPLPSLNLKPAAEAKESVTDVVLTPDEPKSEESAPHQESAPAAPKAYKENLLEKASPLKGENLLGPSAEPQHQLETSSSPPEPLDSHEAANSKEPKNSTAPAEPRNLLPPTPVLGKQSFLWPVLGKVQTPYGKTPDGLFNDGLNIRVRKGTPIRAVESGTVTFAGENIKAYGTIVLIHHGSHWSSAYAHTQKALVKKGQTVKRGQIIAHSGDSGNVTSPQLHFELRYQKRPVNPETYLVPQ